VDRGGFAAAMAHQRERGRRARETTEYLGERERLLKEIREETGDTRFVGYFTLETPAKIHALISGGKRVETAGTGETVEAIIDSTPFYAEAGGQVSDTGILIGIDLKAEVEHVESPVEGLTVHRAKITQGSLREGSVVTASVDAARRRHIARNHTVTHLLHRSLKAILGPHVNQAGSLVAPDRLRFDFTHYRQLTAEELGRIEAMINRAILAAMPVDAFEASMAEAREMGAVALFGEKYGDRVRIVRIGDFSIELCGGTHLKNTVEAGIAKIITEGSVASGVRRIEAVTGEGALAFLNAVVEDYQRTAALLKVPPRDLSSRVAALADNLKEISRENETLKDRIAAFEVLDLLNRVQSVEGVNVLAAKVGTADMAQLRSLVDILRERLGSGVIILGSGAGEKVNLIVAVTGDLIPRGMHAGAIIKKVARVVDGGGGGRPELAQAGGKNPGRLDEALQEGLMLIKEGLAGTEQLKTC
jgi:alanyl-tRNA synthetase